MLPTGSQSESVSSVKQGPSPWQLGDAVAANQRAFRVQRQIVGPRSPGCLFLTHDGLENTDFKDSLLFVYLFEFRSR